MEHTTSEANASEVAGLARTDAHHEGTTSDWEGLAHHETLAESTAGEQSHGRSVGAADNLSRALTTLPNPAPEYVARLLRRIAAKFMVDKATGCHLWTGSRNHDGYSLVGVGVRSHSRSILTTGHRALWLAVRGDLAPGMTLDHTCSRRECVNLAHLEPVTSAENRRRQSVRAQSRRAAEVAR